MNHPTGRPPSGTPNRTSAIRVFLTEEDKAMIQRLAGPVSMSTWVYAHIKPILDGAREAQERQEAT